MTTENLKLPEMLESQGAKHITHNEALQMLDVFVAGTLKSRLVGTPPSDPTLGDAYFIPSGAVDDWSTNVGKIAHWYNGQWYYYPTPNLWLVYFEDEAKSYRFINNDWELQEQGGDFTQFGLGASGKFITITDYNELDQLQTGFYSSFHADTSTVSNKPNFKSATNVNVIIKVVKESDRFSVEVVETKRTDSRHFRVKTGASTWGSWRDLWAEIAAAAGSGGGSELTAAEIKTLYESNPDTNVFTDAEEATIANLGASAFLESFKDYGLGITGNAPTVVTTQADTTQIATMFGRGQLDNGTFTTFVNLRANSNRQSQIHIAYGGDPRLWFRTMVSNDTWSDVLEVYHSGNTINALDYGLSQVFSNTGFNGTLSASKDFADLSTKTQFFGWSTTGNAPSDSFNTTVPLASAGVRMCSSTLRYADFLITTQGAGTAASPWFKSYDGGSDSGWQEIYHSGNLDPDAIDKSTGKAYADMTAGNVTLNTTQSNVPVIQLGGTPGASRTLTVAALERMWVVTNDSDGGCTLTTGSGGTVFLEAGYQYVVFGDGVGVRAAVTIAPNGLKMNGDLILPIYSTASLPDPSTRYMVTVGCTDGDNGSPCLAVSDGGSWKRIALGATVSAT